MSKRQRLTKVEKADWKDAKKAIEDAGYITAPSDYFQIPRIGETYLDVDGKVVTMELRSDPVCGPRLILVKRKRKVLVFDYAEMVEAIREGYLAADVSTECVRVGRGRFGINGTVEEREV